MSKETTATADIPFPNPTSTTWATADPTHPTFALEGIDDTPGRKAYFIHLEALPGKEEELASFLRDINAGVEKEPGTGPWFGTRFSKSTFCIFEAFPDAERRHDHDAGPGGLNFGREEWLRGVLAKPARIYRLDVLHGKFGTMFGEEVGPVGQ